MAAATTATPRLATGLGLSMMSRPPTSMPLPPPAAPNRPGSGRFRRAERRLRVQLSMVFCRRV